MYGCAALEPEPISVTAPAAGASARAGTATSAPTRVLLLIDLNGVPFGFERQRGASLNAPRAPRAPAQTSASRSIYDRENTNSFSLLIDLVGYPARAATGLAASRVSVLPDAPRSASCGPVSSCLV